MLDNLLDIEVAYSLLRGGSDDSSKDPIDVNYEKLKTEIKVTASLKHLKHLFPRALVSKLKCTSGSPGELPKTGCWGPKTGLSSKFQLLLVVL